jgi:hypothetical protein
VCARVSLRPLVNGLLGPSLFGEVLMLQGGRPGAGGRGEMPVLVCVSDSGVSIIQGPCE